MKYKDKMKYFYSRHRSCVEGRNGEAKEQHALRRAARRGIEQVLIQAYMTAVVMNLKRLGAFVFALFRLMKRSMKGLIAIINSYANIGWLVSNNRLASVTSR